MSRGGNWFFGRHFVIVYPIFDFFIFIIIIIIIIFFFFFLLYVGSFGLHYQWPAFHRQIHSEKYFSELGSIGTPLITNRSTLYLDHFSVN